MSITSQHVVFANAHTPRPFIRPAEDQTVAAFAVDLVVHLGAQTAYSLTGGMAMYLNRAVATHPALKAVYCQHEQACAAAAEGYAKAKDFAVPGLAVVTSGPGVTNTITSLCSAYGDSAPVIVLAGQIKTADIDKYGSRTHGAQEVRSLDLVAPCVKRAVRLNETDFLPQLIETLCEAFCGRPGPVFIEIPLDVQNRAHAFGPEDIEAAAEEIASRIATDVGANDAQGLSHAIRWLSEAERPLIYAGSGCRIAGVGEALRSLIDQTRWPVVNSWLTGDLLPQDHPSVFDAPGGLAPVWSNRILCSSDRILFLGARLDLGTTAFQRDDFGAQASRIFVDIDARELKKFEGLERVDTQRLNLKGLVEAVRLNAHLAATPSQIAWAATCQDIKAQEFSIEAEKLAGSTLTVRRLAQRLSALATQDVFVPTSSGSGSETFLRFFRPPTGSRCIFGASLGSMGMGLPQALGAAFANRGRVICIEGDGGLMLNIQELATLSHYAPPGFVLMVMNNDGYLSIRMSQQRHFKSVGGADVASGVFIPSYKKLADAFGLAYQSASTLEELDAILPELAPDAPPIIIELFLDNPEPRGAGVTTVIDQDGTIRSTPISDLRW